MFFRVISFIGRHLPLRAGRALGNAVGVVAWHVLRGERRKALRHIAMAFPEWSEAERRRTIKRMFRHLGVTLFEMLWLPNLNDRTRATTTTIENAEASIEAVRQGKGIIGITGHCGNWEWLAACSASLIPLTVIQRERRERGLGELVESLRKAAGILTIDRGSGDSAREMIRAIRGQRMLAFLLDQNIRAESVKVPFFGRPALTPIGPAKLAIRAETPVVCIFITRDANGIQHIRYNDPIRPKRGDDPVALTAEITRQIEAHIRAVPDQWVWMHDRWRERPKWDVTSAEGSPES